MEELDSIKKILDPKTPIGWLKEILSSELWEEELFQGGDVPLPPGLQTTWNQLSHHLGNYHQIPETTTRAWRLALSSGNTECSGKCQTWMRATCKECGHTRCSFSFCSDYCITILNHVPPFRRSHPLPPWNRGRRLGQQRSSQPTYTRWESTS
jgi:hypothetical protein